MSFAAVKVFPVPVAPRRTWCFRPPSTPSDRAAIAVGWSPVGSYGALTLRSGIGSILATFLTGAVRHIRAGHRSHRTQPNGLYRYPGPLHRIAVAAPATRNPHTSDGDC